MDGQALISTKRTSYYYNYDSIKTVEKPYSDKISKYGFKIEWSKICPKFGVRIKLDWS